MVFTHHTMSPLETFPTVSQGSNSQLRKPECKIQGVKLMIEPGGAVGVMKKSCSAEYMGAISGAYSGDHTGAISGVYSGDHVTGAISGAYSGDHVTGAISGAYSGADSGAYIGAPVGASIGLKAFTCKTA
jgi:hypothetical protein